MKDYILRGDFCYSETKQKIKTVKNGYVVCVDGVSKGVYADFDEIPVKYQSLSVEDYKDQLIIPGLVDLHVHAPQYSFRGLGMDMELLDWLNINAFPEEQKYESLEYAKKAYGIFVDDLKKSATTRASIFATLHAPATKLLMELMEEAKVAGYVGKVNMNRNSPDYLREKDVKSAIEITKTWICETKDAFSFVKPILTPRFTPSCTDELMRGLAKLQKKYGLPMQSHLSENRGEIEWVKQLCPNTHFYGEAYEQFDLFGNPVPTIMAHCVLSTKEEMELMKQKHVYIAHCPQSNTNLASGIAPVRKYLDGDLCIGLGSDVAGGASLSIFRAMTDAIQVSKLYWRYVDETVKPITMEEAFYMGTKGGGAFFGKVGSFEEGYEMDAVVLDESKIRHPQELKERDRLERLLYLADLDVVSHKYVKGLKVF